MTVKVTAEFDLEDFEDVLKAARKADKRTATEIAAAAGISTAHMYSVESGAAVSANVLSKLCEVLGVQMPELKIGGDRNEA